MKYAFTITPVDGYTQRNPTYWDVSTPPNDAQRVLIDPKFPQIIAHFRAIGVPVEIVGEVAKKAAPEVENEKPAAVDQSLTDLRDGYAELFGKKAYHGWSADQLKSKMDARAKENEKLNASDN